MSWCPFPISCCLFWPSSSRLDLLESSCFYDRKHLSGWGCSNSSQALQFSGVSWCVLVAAMCLGNLVITVTVGWLTLVVDAGISAVEHGRRNASIKCWCNCRSRS